MIKVKLILDSEDYRTAIFENKFIIDLSLHQNRYQQIRKFKINKFNGVIERNFFQFEDGAVDGFL